LVGRARTARLPDEHGGWRQIFRLETERAIGNDWVIRHHGRYLQPQPGQKQSEEPRRKTIPGVKAQEHVASGSATVWITPLRYALTGTASGRGPTSKTTYKGDISNEL